MKKISRRTRGAVVAVVASAFLQLPVAGQSRASRAQRMLGERLFDETALGDPGGDFQTSCSTCHAVGADPRGGADRLYTDGQARSLMPGHGSVNQETTRRNTPSLFDLADADRFGLDGRFATLEDLIDHKLRSPHLGWAADREELARTSLSSHLLNEPNTDYEALFRDAYQVDLAALSDDEVWRATVRALADYVREIQSLQTSRWDAFADMNRIPIGPARDEPPSHYAGRIQGRIGNQEGRVLIKRPLGFSPEAYLGFKTFFRVEGEASVGNCVACHVPPAFTDFRFHALGISVAEYEATHGEGSFERLQIPGAEAQRPVAALGLPPREDRPGQADLGYWNWVDPASAPEGVSAAQYLAEQVGAFRTPSLRNLPRTAPYMHNGAYATLHDAVGEIASIAERARADGTGHVDPEVAKIVLSEQDVDNLVAFLESIDDVDPTEFRNLLLHFEED